MSSDRKDDVAGTRGVTRRQFERLAVTGLAAGAAGAASAASTARAAAGPDHPVFVKRETSLVHGGEDKLDAASPEFVTVQLGSGSAVEIDPTTGKRLGNPTRERCGRLLASIDGGATAFLYPSGSSANRAVLELLRPGERVIADIGVWGGSQRLLARLAERGIGVDYVDALDAANVAAALTPATRMILIEPMTQPTTRVVDLEGIGRLGRAKGLVTIADNSALTGLIVRPLDHGITLVTQTTGKFIGGHGDLYGGYVVIGPDGGEVAGRLSDMQQIDGDQPGAIDTYLALRSTATLGVRLSTQCRNTERIVDWLRARSGVSAVFYPGLSSPAQEDRVRRLLSARGAILGFRPEGGGTRAAAIMSRFKLISTVGGYGHVATVASIATQSTSKGMTSDNRARLGIDDGILRIGVGIENPDDVIADLDQAMAG